MAHTETKEIGLFSQLKDSIKGLAVGLLFIMCAPCILFCNEKNFVETAEGIGELSGALSEPDAAKADAKEGDPILISGDAKSAGTLSDASFGIEEKGAIRLSRSVEMYQWVEKKTTKTKKKGTKKVETTTYKYTKAWKGTVEDTSKFNKKGVKEEREKGKKISNPSSIPVEKKSWTAKEVKLGAYTLSKAYVSQIGEAKAVKPTDEMVDAAKKEHEKAKKDGTYVYINASGKKIDPAKASVGDVRIKWEVVGAAEVTAIGTRSGTQLVPWKASNGKVQSQLAYGKKSPAEMISSAEEGNAAITWGLRILGLLLLFFGFMALFRPLVVLADVVPFLGTIVGGGTFAVSAGLSVVIGFGCIAIGWIVARPLVGGLMCLVSIGALAGVIVLGLKAKKKKMSDAPAEA
jgi:hypothetical protein